jgi:hypothetical protein
MDTLRALLQRIVELIDRFIQANPRNAYEQAVFQAVRSIIITAFLKPLRGTHAGATPAHG